MANIGDVLTQPESGWKRYDDSEQVFEYIDGVGTWEIETLSDHYQGSCHRIYDTDAKDAKVKFGFKGSKLRILTRVFSNGRTDKVEVKIDGVVVGYYSLLFPNYTSATSQVLVYEILNLPFDYHSVELTVINSGQFYFDIVDIDYNGELLPYADVYFLLKSKNKIQTLQNDIWIYDLQITAPTQESFEQYGIKNLSILKNDVTKIQLPKTKNSLGDGTEYRWQINKSQYGGIKTFEIK